MTKSPKIFAPGSPPPVADAHNDGQDGPDVLDRPDPKGPSYTVGYGKPPRHGQFHPGQSGNPSGRPRRSRNLSTILTEELNKPVAVREGGKVRKLPKRTALVVGMINKALAGDPRIAGWLLPNLLRIESDQAARGQATEALTQDDQKILADYLRRISGKDTAGG